MEIADEWGKMFFREKLSPSHLSLVWVFVPFFIDSSTFSWLGEQSLVGGGGGRTPSSTRKTWRTFYHPHCNWTCVGCHHTYILADEKGKLREKKQIEFTHTHTREPSSLSGLGDLNENLLSTSVCGGVKLFFAFKLRRKNIFLALASLSRLLYRKNFFFFLEKIPSRHFSYENRRDDDAMGRRWNR